MTTFKELAKLFHDAADMEEKMNEYRVNFEQADEECLELREQVKNLTITVKNLTEEIEKLKNKTINEQIPVCTLDYYSDGTVYKEMWKVNDKYHRKDGPAHTLFDFNGQITYEGWYANGQLHRPDKPAEIWYSNGIVAHENWYLNGKIEKSQVNNSDKRVKIISKCTLCNKKHHTFPIRNGTIKLEEDPHLPAGTKFKYEDSTFIIQGINPQTNGYFGYLNNCEICEIIEYIGINEFNVSDPDNKWKRV